MSRREERSDHLRIHGVIRECESGLGVRGLIVRAYDKDLIFDDLLGNATTDSAGRFEIHYSPSDYQEFFDGRPDLYLVVVAPPTRRLLDTCDSVRHGAGEHEEFELEIPRARLGELAPELPDDRVAGDLNVTAKDLRWERRGEYDLPRLPGFSTTGLPGAPALPGQTQFVILPLGTEVTELVVRPGEPVRHADRNPFPAQSPVLVDDHERDEFEEGLFARDFMIDFTPPNRKLYERGEAFPERLAEVVKMEKTKLFQVAVVEVRPMQWDPGSRSLLFYPELSYQVVFELERAKAAAERRTAKEQKIDYHQAELLDDLFSNPQVRVAKAIDWPTDVFFAESPHLIITDNHQWPAAIDRGDGSTRAPGLAERGAQLPGNLVTEFWRLAQWKNARGVGSRVVTVSDIVDGRWGDFTEGGFARDLQEVIRNFLKHAHEVWDTQYVLLGGDLELIPMRRLMGVKLMSDEGSDPPKKGNVYHGAGKPHAKLHLSFEPSTDVRIVTHQSGLLIPYDREAGGGRLGWYHTTEDDFDNNTQGFTRRMGSQPTRYVIVEGPPAVLHDDYCWVDDANNIPSDFYYASLAGQHYGKPGIHDFDGNNNGLYGQHVLNPDNWRREGTPIENFDEWIDVHVGRVPVKNGDEAAGFVDKVLTYEKLETPGGAKVHPSYLRKVIFAAHYWARVTVYRQADTGAPPSEGRFTHAAGDDFAKVHPKHSLKLPDKHGLYNLYAKTGTDRTFVPYKAAATPANPGWFYVTDDDYDTASASPTFFLTVVGPEALTDPDRYLVDPIGEEGATVEKERLRKQVEASFPALDQIERHYEDYFDIQDPPPPALIPLDAQTLRDHIDQGAHFVSLTGHGSSNGCCGVSISSRPDFENDGKYFVMFANSCTTAKPDVSGGDSLAERAIKDPDGGAIGYVGNTRGGWVGIGDDYEEFFWCVLASSGRLGPAANFRLSSTGIRSWWTAFTQTLFGDPETPIWKDVPSQYEVLTPDLVEWGGTLTVGVAAKQQPLGDQKVTLTVRSKGVEAPLFRETRLSNADGRASFRLPTLEDGPDEVEISVAQRGYQTWTSKLGANPKSRP